MLTPTNANAISRLLKRNGFTTTNDRKYQGVRVSRGPLRGSAVVSVDIDLRSRREDLCKLVGEILTDAGYDFDRMTPTYFHINGRETTTEKATAL